TFDQLNYFGKGPHESYQDRQLGAKLGRYQQTLAQFGTPYIRPQEHSNHMGIREIHFTNTQQKGITIQGQALNISAYPYTIDELDQAQHTVELPQRDFITVNIDAVQMGLGGDNTWDYKAAPHSEHQIQPGRYQLAFVLSPKQ
ncbi:MAG: glycoside hydrolase family 2, partial [Bacteroidota bacterium]